MKVLFIWPNLHSEVGFNHGIASLSAVLREAGHETSLININENLAPEPTEEELLLRVNAEKPGLVAFSATTPQFPYAAAIAAGVHRAFPHVPIVIGGVHATIAPQAVLEAGVFDYACVGEGEGALLDLVKALVGRADTTMIGNLWARTSAGIHRNPVRPFAQLGALPPRDYSIFEVERMIDANEGRVALVASRGCPLECECCVNRFVKLLYERDTGLAGKDSKYYRRHAVGDVIDEVKYLAGAYPAIKAFVFDDEFFTFNKRTLKEFTRKYRAATDIPFACTSQPWAFDAVVARTLAEGGCAVVRFALHSGSARLREETFARRVTDSEILAAFAAASEAGLETSAFVMLGMPGETAAELGETLRLVAQLKPGLVNWAPFVPCPEPVDAAATGGPAMDLERLRAKDESATGPILDFGPEANLHIRKLLAAYPWYVNALSTDAQVGRLYSRLTSVINNLDETAFEDFRAGIPRFDNLLRQVLSKAGREHYSMRYNALTAVASSWNR